MFVKRTALRDPLSSAASVLLVIKEGVVLYGKHIKPVSGMALARKTTSSAQNIAVATCLWHQVHTTAGHPVDLQCWHDIEANMRVCLIFEQSRCVPGSPFPGPECKRYPYHTCAPNEPPVIPGLFLLFCSHAEL